MMHCIGLKISFRKMTSFLVFQMLHSKKDIL